MTTCICHSVEPKDKNDLAHYGCPEEICPGCYDTKPHDDRHCSQCRCRTGLGFTPCPNCTKEA
jgi:hypothetical protein